MKDRMPQKYEGGDLEKQMDYVARLLAFLKGQKSCRSSCRVGKDQPFGGDDG